MRDTTDAEIQKLLRGVKRISSPPTVLTKINSLCADPDACVADFERALSTDQSLVLRLLKMVNTAFYGLPGKVDSISRAILIIGFRGVRELVFASSLFNTIGHRENTGFFDIELFWQHSFASGVASRILADLTHKENPESYFIAGLLHDIGRLVLLESKGDGYGDVFRLAEKEGCALTDAETRSFGFTHAEVGKELTILWKLPRSLAQAVAYHHKPSRCLGVSPHADIVHLANVFVTSAQIGDSGDRFVPPLDTKAWDRTALSIDQVGLILDRIEEQYEEGVSFLRSGLRAA